MARELPDFVTGLVEHRPAGPVAGHAPDPGHAAPVRRGHRRDPGQHQPADRAAGHRHRREHRHHRRAGRRADLEDHARARATCGSATPRWCRSRRAGSAAGGRATSRARAPADRGWRGWSGTARPPGARAAAARRRPEEEEITDLTVLVDRPSGGQPEAGAAAAAQPVAAAAAGVDPARRAATAEDTDTGDAGRDAAGHAAGRDGHMLPSSRTRSTTCPQQARRAAVIDFASFGQPWPRARRAAAGHSAAHARRFGREPVQLADSHLRYRLRRLRAAAR